MPLVPVQTFATISGVEPLTSVLRNEQLRIGLHGKAVDATTISAVSSFTDATHVP